MSYLNNFALEGFLEDEGSLSTLVGMALNDGKEIVGYYGLPYINAHYGEVQLIVQTDYIEDREQLSAVRLDEHSSGDCVWNVKVSGMDIDLSEGDRLCKRVAVTRADDEDGLATIYVVNADVIPSYSEGDIVKMQVIALPNIIEYYKDEEEYYKSYEGESPEKTLYLEDGSILPTGLLDNRNPNSKNFNKNENFDEINTIRGTVQSVVWGRLEVFDKTFESFIRCKINTQFGPLEVLHTVEQVEESQRKNIKVGATVYFCGRLSGDVAIYEYENGIVLNEEHNLRVLRTVFCGNDPERARSILSDNCVYCAEYNNKQYNGPDEILNRLKYVNEAIEAETFAHRAKISFIEDGDEKLDYGVGKECLVLATGEEDNYQSIVFIDVNEEGYVTRIFTSINPKYHFKLDEL